MPQNPTYPKTIPVTTNSDKNKSNNSFYIPKDFLGIKYEKLQSLSPELIITKEVNGNEETFKLTFVDYLKPELSLSLEGFQNDLSRGNPVLLGVTIDEIRLTWTLNKAVDSQILINTANVNNPTIESGDRSATLIGLNIEADVLNEIYEYSFTLTVDDGENTQLSEINDVATITFGNYFYYGHEADLRNIAIANIQTRINNLAGKDIVRNFNKSFYGTGSTGEHFIIAYPKRFGLLNSIYKAPFNGGYVRLKNVSGVLKETVGELETESDIILNNGFVNEPYYIYQSAFDNQSDPNNLIVVS